MVQGTVDFGTNGQAILNSIFGDDGAVGFGSGSPGQIVWDTSDANANMLKIEVPTGGAVDVPVVLVGIGHIGVDLGFFNGVTQPTLGIVDTDRDSYIVMDFSADDAARIRANRDIDLSIIDNSATSMTIKQGSDAYLIIDTADSSESVSIGTGISGTAITLGHATSETTVADNLSVTGDLAVDGTANLDNTDIDGTLVVDGTNISLDSTTTFNIDNSNTSNGITIATATSGVPISIGHATSEVTVNDNLTVTGRIFLNDSANTNMTTGLTINQGAADDHILVFKSSDVNTAMSDLPIYITGGTGGGIEPDDFLVIQKRDGPTGGVVLGAIGESGLGTPFTLETWGGAPTTSDTTGSRSAIVLAAGQHDNGNADVDMADNSNLFSLAEIDSGGNVLTRLIVKADDGELHLGNTTLVGIDDEEDALVIRAFQRESSASGIIDNEYDNPFYDYDWLRKHGLADPKDPNDGFFMFPLQPRLNAHEGAIWQNYTAIQNIATTLIETQRRLESAESTLKALEAA